MEVKQIIVMRKDLKNTQGHKVHSGKLVSQGAHSSCKNITDNIKWDTLKETDLPHLFEVTLTLNKKQISWLRDNPFTKICLAVHSEEELMEIYEKATLAGIQTTMINDSGRTEFDGKETTTCISLGPDTDEKLNPITGHLKLF